jgi:hypothetical protein
VALAAGCSSSEAPWLPEDEDAQPAEVRDPAPGVPSPELVVDRDAVQDGDEESCDDDFVDPIAIGWNELDAGSAVAVDPADIPWSLANLGAHDLTLGLELTFDLGALTLSSHPIGEVTVEAGASHVGSVNLAQLVDDFESMEFSGMAILIARGEEFSVTKVSAPLFFHPGQDGSLWAYGEPVLHSEFSHGDFRHELGDAEEDGAFTSRVVSAVGVILDAGDDQLELEAIDEPDPEPDPD